MLNQDQNQGGKCRRTCATDQMLRKTVLPVIAIALCVLLFLAVSGTQATAAMASVATSGTASDAHKLLSALERPASLTDKQWLGKQLFFDPNLSTPAGLACAACHASQDGWHVLGRPRHRSDARGSAGRAGYGPVSEPAGAEQRERRRGRGQGEAIEVREPVHGGVGRASLRRHRESVPDDRPLDCRIRALRGGEPVRCLLYTSPSPRD